MGFSALAIADRLGHESIEVTMMYAHLSPINKTRWRTSWMLNAVLWALSQSTKSSP